MDVNGLNDLYSQYAASQAGNTKLQNTQNTLENKDYSKATDEELMEACKSFEAYFLETMYKEMLKTVPESEISSGANSSLLDYYKDEAIQKIADESVDQNSLGLAQTLFEQMKRNYEV